MLRIFRKIRLKLMSQNKIRSYVFYAAGEVLLVVLGILIALQVNNWNEERKLSMELDSFARAMVSDLESDIEALDISIHQAKLSTVLLDSLINYSRSVQQIEDIRNIDLYVLSRRSSYRAIAWSRSTFEEFKNSGALRYVENDSLLKMLNRYEAFSYHLDTDLIDDDESGKAFNNVMWRVLDKNYPAGADLYPNWFEVPAYEVPDFSKYADYQTYSMHDLDILTDDINEFKIVINHAIDLENNLRIRAETEFPEARALAIQIIDMLKKEYGVK